MTLKPLGGACNEVFPTDTFEEITALSKAHSMAMFAKKDASPSSAMEAMKSLMQSPQAMQDWMAQKRQEFQDLPDEE